MPTLNPVRAEQIKRIFQNKITAQDEKRQIKAIIYSSNVA